MGDAALVASLMFAAAGTVGWARGWTLIGVMLGIRLVGALAVYRVSPALMRERSALPVHHQQSSTDRALVLAVLASGFVGLPIVAALDVFRWHVSATPSRLVSIAGLSLFAIGWTLKSLALRANAFAVTVVRVQRERKHSVADTGVYRVVRHPFYAADPLILVGLGLWLGSYVAAVAAALPVGLMAVRLVLEERFLRAELPGYVAYAERVRYRLIPGIW